MPQYVARDPAAKIRGSSVAAVLAALENFRHTADAILRGHGIADPDPEGWYSQQAWLDACCEMAATLGGPTVRLIAGKIPAVSRLPPGIDSIPAFLARLDEAYHPSHRGEVGHYRYRPLGRVTARSGRAEVVCDNPYPCEYDEGLIESSCRACAGPEAGAVRVGHDRTKPCRKRGVESCTLVVEWG